MRIKNNHRIDDNEGMTVECWEFNKTERDDHWACVHLHKTLVTIWWLLYSMVWQRVNLVFVCDCCQSLLIHSHSQWGTDDNEFSCLPVGSLYLCCVSFCTCSNSFVSYILQLVQVWALSSWTPATVAFVVGCGGGNQGHESLLLLLLRETWKGDSLQGKTWL